MKKLFFSLALLPLVLPATAQTFTNIAVARSGATDKLSFTTKRETNVRYYLVEGSRDNESFEVLSRIAANGNTVLPHSYSATLYDTSYSRYRVRQVDMTAGGIYSSTVHIAPQAAPVPRQEPVIGSDVTAQR